MKSFGELSRKIRHNCDSYRIEPYSHLYNELSNNIAEKKYIPRVYQGILRGKYCLDVAPTIITGENFFEDSTSKFLVYTGKSIDAGQGIYFYSLQTRQTFAKISDAEIFVDLY